MVRSLPYSVRRRGKVESYFLRLKQNAGSSDGIWKLFCRTVRHWNVVRKSDERQGNWFWITDCFRQALAMTFSFIKLLEVNLV